MKKIKIFFLLLAFVLMGGFFSFSKAQVQAPPQTNPDPGVVVIATVNILNPQIISQEDNTFKIGFDIYNQKGVQPQLKYLVQLIEKATGENKSPQIVDQFVYPESINIGENQTIHKEISYIAPNYINGNYEVWIFVRNERSLDLALGMAGGINLGGSGEYVKIIPETCFLSVAGDGKKYELDQGVDIDPEEELSLTCDLQSHFKTQVAVVPNFETYFRSISGELVKEEKQEAININPEEKITKSFKISKANNPQAYDFKLTLKNGEKSVSNKLISHYVIRGKSATIQSFRLDKNSYLKGETAIADLFWTGSADTFSGSRKGTTFIMGYFAKITIVDQEGRSCIADSFKKELSFQGIQTGNDTFEIPIIQDCKNPNVSAKIVDKDDNTLDENKFSLEKKADMSNRLVFQEKNKYKWPIIIAIIITSISFLIIIISRIRKKKSATLLIFMLAIASLIFFAGGKVKADTVYVYTPGWEGDCTRILNNCGAYSSYQECCENTNYCWYAGWTETFSRCLDTGNPDSKFAIYNVSLNKTYYEAGETVIAYLQVAKRAHCYNGGYAGQIDVQYPLTGGGMGYTSPWALFHDHNTYNNPNGVFTFQAPIASVSGWYSVNFYLYTTPSDMNKHQVVGKVYSKSIYVKAQAINGTCGSSNGQSLNIAPTTNLCNSGSTSAVSGSGPWNWVCYGSGGGSNANCSANKCLSNCSSGPLCGGQVDGCGGTCPKNTFSAQCGNASSKIWETTPDSELCSGQSASSGDPSILDGKWTWKCLGCDDGNVTSADCVAKRDINMKEVTP